MAWSGDGQKKSGLRLEREEETPTQRKQSKQEMEIDILKCMTVSVYVLNYIKS